MGSLFRLLNERRLFVKDDFWLVAYMNLMEEIETKPSRARSLRRSVSYLVGPMFFYRISHSFYRIGFWPIAEIFRYLGVFFFHCDISYKAVIGSRVSLTHYGLGVVIGKYARIADECVIMPGVLIGATLRDQRMPQLMNAVVVGAGAKVLGAIVIGEGVPARFVWTRFCNSGCLSHGISLTGFVG